MPSQSIRLSVKKERKRKKPKHVFSRKKCLKIVPNTNWRKKEDTSCSSRVRERERAAVFYVLFLDTENAHQYVNNWLAFFGTEYQNNAC